MVNFDAVPEDPVLSTYVIDIRSERRSEGTVQRFLFPLSQAGIQTPANASVNVRATGGQVPLQEATVEALNKQFRVYLDNFPTRTNDTATANQTNDCLAIAHGDYRLKQSVYADFNGDAQPTIQMMPGVLLPDVYVTLLDENNEPFFPGADWTITLQITADQSRYARWNY